MIAPEEAESSLRGAAVGYNSVWFSIGGHKFKLTGLRHPRQTQLERPFASLLCSLSL